MTVRSLSGRFVEQILYIFIRGKADLNYATHYTFSGNVKLSKHVGRNNCIQREIYFSKFVAIPNLV